MTVGAVYNIDAMMCTVPMFVQFSPALKSYGIEARIVRSSELSITPHHLFERMSWMHRGDYFTTVSPMWNCI